MAKQRRTKKEKVSAHKGMGFKVKAELLRSAAISPKKQIDVTTISSKYFRRDLTKTLFLTMLAVALELALWQYLFKR